MVPACGGDIYLYVNCLDYMPFLIQVGNAVSKSDFAIFNWCLLR